MEYHFIVVPELDTDSQPEINAARTVIGHIHRACKATWPLSITQVKLVEESSRSVSGSGTHITEYGLLLVSLQ